MTFEEYIKNPMGPKASVVTNRYLYQEMYTNKWNTLLVREDGKIAYKLYKTDDDYYIHIKIPSEVVPKFYYDTIIKFYLTKENKTHTSDRTLSNYEVQFYSNDPHFVYSFAHAFRTHKLLIPDLEFKMNKQALEEKAVIKNPKDELGYVKSLYFAYLQMKNLNLFDKNRWSIAEKYTSNIWKKVVEHASDKIQKRQELGRAIQKKEKREKKTQKISTRIVNKLKPFVSPNIPNFGHIKKTNFNKKPTLITSTIKEAINKIKKKK